MRKKLLLGLAPTRRFVFSAEDAARYKVLVEEKLKGWGVEFVNIDSVNPEGLLYERGHAVAAAVFAPHVNFGTEEVVSRLARFDGIGGEYSLLMGHGRGTEGPFTGSTRPPCTRRPVTFQACSPIPCSLRASRSACTCAALRSRS